MALVLVLVPAEDLGMDLPDHPIAVGQELGKEERIAVAFAKPAMACSSVVSVAACYGHMLHARVAVAVEEAHNYRSRRDAHRLHMVTRSDGHLAVETLFPLEERY